ncbi:MAG: SbcC/MukB-like Walker B domain-containing protein [Clostridiaceae bacterium]|nr:SbcC/MukB-like Walker B domain-containing protein [Clostridiaceae bacterium]
MKNIYYGEDSYKFDVSANNQKEKLYQMIMSPSNEVGFNLWSQSFDAEYHDEMEDLFAKLTAYDDRGDKVLEEYTDYRNYLDYDILVEKRNGSVQRFSRIYGEKSGGETQTPYYVAIAASFVQLYKSGDTIRIIMFDEAFDKMDDNRISAMMDFLNSQNFQIIVATPPAKIEVIGEKVDTILMAMREGTSSIVEEYEL